MVIDKNEKSWEVYFEHFRHGQTLVEVEMSDDGLLVGGELIEMGKIRAALKIKQVKKSVKPVTRRGVKR